MEDRWKRTLAIEGKDEIRRVVEGVAAKPPLAEIVGDPSVDEWETQPAEDEFAVLVPKEEEEIENERTEEKGDASGPTKKAPPLHAYWPKKKIGIGDVEDPIKNMLQLCALHPRKKTVETRRHRFFSTVSE